MTGSMSDGLYLRVSRAISIDIASNIGLTHAADHPDQIDFSNSYRTSRKTIGEFMQIRNRMRDPNSSCNEKHCTIR